MKWLVKLGDGKIWNRRARISRLTQDPRRLLARKKILESTTFHDGQVYDDVWLWAAANIQLLDNYFSSLVQFKYLDKRLLRDTTLKENYAKTIDEDLRKGYVISVPDAQLVRQWSDKEWYLPHHPVSNPNKPGKVRRVQNGAAKFHTTLLNKSLLTGHELLQNVIHVLLRFRQHQFVVSADIEGCSSRLVYQTVTSHHCVFCGV